MVIVEQLRNSVEQAVRRTVKGMTAERPSEGELSCLNDLCQDGKLIWIISAADHHVRKIPTPCRTNVALGTMNFSTCTNESAIKCTLKISRLPL